VHTKSINPPPACAPSYFQDRHVETDLIGRFLKDDTVRLISVVGRGGTGKTAMVCRLLKSLEGGQLPDDGGPLSVDGIVYISRHGSRPVNLPNVYADLAKLLPNDQAARLEGLYKAPQATTVAKMRALLEAFPSGRAVLLLDNFEDIVDPATLNMTDPELEEGLRALLQLPEHGVKVIVTTRLATRSLALVEPGRQRRLDLDEGLSSPYAEQILQVMDVDGALGLKTADAALLNEARFRTRGYPRALEALFAILSVDRDTALPDLLKHAERRNLLPEDGGGRPGRRGIQSARSCRPAGDAGSSGVRPSRPSGGGRPPPPAVHYRYGQRPSAQAPSQHEVRTGGERALSSAPRRP
jgi:hypothetical protein